MAGRTIPNPDERGSTEPQLNGEPSRADEVRTAMSGGGGRHGDPFSDRELPLAVIHSVAPDAIVAVGGDARIRVFNAGAENLFGFRAADIMGRPLDDLIPACFQAAHAAHVARFPLLPLVQRAGFGSARDWR